MSNDGGMNRKELLKRLYVNCCVRIENRFIERLVADKIPGKVGVLMIASYRMAAIDMLDEIERAYGLEGLHKMSYRLSLCEECAALSKEEEVEEDRGDRCDGSEAGDAEEIIDDEPQTYDKADSKNADRLNHFGKPGGFPMALTEEEDVLPILGEFDDDRKEDDPKK